MPNQPHSQNILDDVAATLKGIDGSDAYHNNIYGRVSPFTESIPAQFLFPGIMTGIHSEVPKPNQNVTWGSNDLYESYLNFETWGWVQHATTRDVEAQKLAMDIRTALEADCTLGGTVSALDWLGTDYWLPEDDRNIAVCVVKWRALYHVNRQDTSRSLA